MEVFTWIKSFFINDEKQKTIPEYNTIIETIHNTIQTSLKNYLLKDIINIVMEYSNIIDGHKYNNLNKQLLWDIFDRYTILSVKYTQNKYLYIIYTSNIESICTKYVYIKKYDVNTLEQISCTKLKYNVKKISSWHTAGICELYDYVYFKCEYDISNNIYYMFYSLTTGDQISEYLITNSHSSELSTNEKYMYIIHYDNPSILQIIDIITFKEINRIKLQQIEIEYINDGKLIVSDNKIIIHEYHIYIYEENTFELLYSFYPNHIVQHSYYNYYFYKNLLYVVNGDNYLFVYDKDNKINEFKLNTDIPGDIIDLFIHDNKVFILKDYSISNDLLMFY
jgi:hypothetical protein